mmetsp:Transcript_212/g.463  ORF Transcript_212/g.463 Transcript_212/m.463 type:complete len:484 (+) Transcript_212:182-1633(+)
MGSERRNEEAKRPNLPGPHYQPSAHARPAATGSGHTPALSSRHICAPLPLKGLHQVPHRELPVDELTALLHLVHRLALLLHNSRGLGLWRGLRVAGFITAGIISLGIGRRGGLLRCLQIVVFAFRFNVRDGGDEPGWLARAALEADSITSLLSHIAFFGHLWCNSLCGGRFNPRTKHAHWPVACADGVEIRQQGQHSQFHKRGGRQPGDRDARLGAAHTAPCARWPHLPIDAVSSQRVRQPRPLELEAVLPLNAHRYVQAARSELPPYKDPLALQSAVVRVKSEPTQAWVAMDDAPVRQPRHLLRTRIRCLAHTHVGRISWIVAHNRVGERCFQDSFRPFEPNHDRFNSLLYGHWPHIVICRAQVRNSMIQAPLLRPVALRFPVGTRTKTIAPNIVCPRAIRSVLALPAAVAQVIQGAPHVWAAFPNALEASLPRFVLHFPGSPAAIAIPAIAVLSTDVTGLSALSFDATCLAKPPSGRNRPR